MPAPRAIAALSVLLMLGVLVLDSLTPANLVVGILLNVPIALSAFAASRRLTLWLIVGALAANALAALLNARVAGGFEALALWNRAFSVLSSALVGYLVLGLRGASARAERLELQERRAGQERGLRELVAGVGGSAGAQELVERAAQELVRLMGAQEVVIGTIEAGRLTQPYASQPAGVRPLPGELLDADLAARPNREPPVETLSDGQTMLGRWRRRDAPELLVVVRSATEPERLLGEALAALEPILEQTVLLDRLRRQRDELGRRNDVIRDLVYAFSHDLRTPLMANAMHMNLALRGAYGELREDYQASLRNGLAANQDVLDLADKLLLVAKLESGEVGETTTDLDLAALVRRRAEEMRAGLEARVVQLDLRLDGPMPIRGNASELRRVAQNLLDNAGKFSKPGGTVTVRLTSEDGQAVLSVEDMGPGVPPEMQGRLFQRFRGAGAGAGSGLGLYLARSIVAAHGGQLTYRRQAGTSIFEARFPLRHTDQQA